MTFTIWISFTWRVLYNVDSLLTAATKWTTYFNETFFDWQNELLTVIKFQYLLHHRMTTDTKLIAKLLTMSKMRWLSTYCCCAMYSSISKTSGGSCNISSYKLTTRELRLREQIDTLLILWLLCFQLNPKLQNCWRFEYCKSKFLYRIQKSLHDAIGPWCLDNTADPPLVFENPPLLIVAFSDLKNPPLSTTWAYPVVDLASDWK